jgi:hypothetical protein
MAETAIPTSRSIVPSKLYRVKIFESSERFKKSGDGWKRLDDSDDTLEQQIDVWVNQTKNLVMATGPVTITERTLKATRQERRTLALTYVPAVEQGTQIYGQQQTAIPSRPTVEPAQREGTTSAPRISDGPTGRLRTPSVG